MERINVSVRARPLSPEDAKTSPWRISGNSIFIPNQPSKFEFDQIFREDCKTLQVYECRTKDIVASAVRGFNGTVFAYGQTNSGKTHTMRGSATEPGVIPLAVHDLFETIQEERDREFLLRMSYMEIYNEEINDLLAPEHRKLQIHESIERGIYVAGLREEIVASPEQVLELMEFGESHRHIGETNMNVYSSRSHTIFRMIIESRDKTEDEGAESSCDAVRVSVLNLVDLAGSERAAKTGAEGVRLKEGSHINKSLMTLGTVIKKLSEGAESQGSHVPYRDSKLTRILQPALGGNANTAIICNITLAQIHADETKSSLQFASRALRVTNCVHVNEILTDAALLKRQKKEIEELRAKLQGTHSEYFEEEILNLRNTLLQTELERERFALELEEEKKAQAEKEKRLQEQAKKIENLSSMVLCSNRDENRDPYKKEKRRDTWCPGNLSREAPMELYSTVKEKASAVKPMRTKSETGPLVPFEELVNEASTQEEDGHNNASEDCTLPDPHALLHVTSRRKPPLRKKSLPVENNELVKTQMEYEVEYEDLLLNFETLRTTSDIQIDCLTRNLAEAGFYTDENSKEYPTIHGRTNKSLNEPEAILVIKQLQEKIRMLEMEKSSSQENLDCVVELATEQNNSAKKKFEELYDELLNAREEAKVAREQATSIESVGATDEENFKSLSKLLDEVQEITSEVQNSRNLVESVSSVVDELFQNFSLVLKDFSDLKSFASHNSVLMKSIIAHHEKLHSCMRHQVNILDNEKLLLNIESMDLHNQIEELNQNVQNSEQALTELSKNHEMEASEFLSHIRSLQKELSCLSSSSVAREKESMRKDLEKTKSKLKETEAKLRNAMQDKTKLEGEKASAEREIKKLHGQKAILERDINKRRDSAIDRRSSNMLDAKQAKSVFIDQTMQEDYRKLKVLAFEMETTIASLEEELEAAKGEKEQAIARTESLTLELQSLSDELNASNSELSMLEDVVCSLRSNLEESKSCNEKLESSINMLVEEKEELAMAMEEEKAIWFAKEKVSIEAIEEKSILHNAEIDLLLKEISEVRSHLESSREECKVLRERLVVLEENAELEKKCSMEKSLENDRLRNDLIIACDQSEKSQENLKSKLEMLSHEHRHACDEVEKLHMESSMLNKEREDLLARVRQLEAGSVPIDDFQNLKNQLLVITKEREKLMTQVKEQQRCGIEGELSKESYNERLLKSKAEIEELTARLSNLGVKMHNDEVNSNKEKAKLRMRLRGAQAKLDTICIRYKESIDELDNMKGQYKAASAKLKDQLTSYGTEVLNLKKQLATTNKGH